MLYVRRTYDEMPPARDDVKIHVPNRLLTQQEAWALAHHASGVTSAQENELLDPWDNNQFH